MAEVNKVRINKLIQIRGKMSQKDFATSIDMNPSFYSRLENGITPISDKTMKRIAMQYKIDYNTLIDDTILEITPSDYELEIREVKELSDFRTKMISGRKAHHLLDEIIEYGGRDNFQYMKDLISLLMEIQGLLEYKDQFEDLSENEDKVIDEGQKIIDIIIGMS